MKKESRYLVIIGLFYAAFLLLFISKFNFNASATVEFSQNYLNRTPVTIPGGLVIHQSDGFDGQYYYALAAHHSLKGIPTLKMGENFTQRLIYPLLTYLLSFGNVALFPIMFILINIAAVLLSSHLLMKLLKKHGADLRYVFIWGLSVGLLVSLSRNLTEPLMMLFIACAVYYADQKKQLVAMIFLALSLLTRELAITVWAGFALFYMLRRQWKHLLYAIAAIIPFIGWEYVLYHFTGGIPLLKSSQALSSPVATVSSYGGSASSAVWGDAINPLFHNLNGMTGMHYLEQANRILSPLPLLLCAAILLYILARDFFRERTIRLYAVLLASQIALLASLQKDLLLYGEVDAIGRYSLGIAFFSVLYFAERGKKYPRLILLLMALSAFLYIIQRAFIAKGAFFIT